MDYPNDKEVLESFTCMQTLSVSYHTAHISRAARALASSTKTSLRIDEKGLLSLQFLMPSAGTGGGGAKKGRDAFIEFRVSWSSSFFSFLGCPENGKVLMI
jgi:cell cycle checkpoint protein